jgi:hypothetical protein
MGWLGDLWNSIKGQESVDMMFVRDIDAAPAGAAAFEADKCYVELYVNSLRLRNVRKFATKFDGVVYTFVTLPFQASSNVKIPAISKPENLAQLDPGGISKVIAVNKQMMGSVPWRGGTLLLELGLFSVRGGNLLTPVLDFVTEVSNAAGISFVGKIAPFAPLITKGMNIIAGQSKDVALEVGLDTAFEFAAPGTHAIIAAPKDGQIDRTKLKLDPTDGKLLYDGQPLKAAYCVFSLKRKDIKADYGEIPELKEKFAALRTAIQSEKQDDTAEALSALRVAALTSPDLIRDDAKRLVELAKQMVEDVFPGGAVSRDATGEVGGAKTLEELKLYA